MGEVKTSGSLDSHIMMDLLQIILLASKPTVFTLSLLRMLVHYVYGALIAMVFPETGGRVVCCVVLEDVK